MGMLWISFGLRKAVDRDCACLHRFLRVVAFGDGYIVLMLSLVEGESSLMLLLDSLVESVTSVIYGLQMCNKCK